jgi:HD-like signal output (HDOD) protein/ActR/RegA family two-component response regulator
MEHQKKRILFVSGVTPEVAKLKLEFSARNGHWDAYNAESGLDALDYIAEVECQAVVADLRLEDMTGVQVLNQVAKHQIRAQRILLVDPGDLNSLLRCVGGVHQFLIKPCLSKRLELVLERMQKMDVFLPSLRVHELVGRLPKMPSPPSSYNELFDELKTGSPERGRVARLLQEDPVMTAKLLQLVNSSAYGDPVDYSDPMAAFSGQGTDTLKELIELSHKYSHFNATQSSGFSPHSLWEHSRQVSRLAGWIVEAEEGAEADADAKQLAVTSGLLHDIGKVALAANLPRQFNEAQFHARASKVPFWTAEQQTLGATHSEVGGWMMCTWGLPLPVVEAVTLHHHPSRQPGRKFSALTAVHFANAFSHADTMDQLPALVDTSYVDALRIRHRVPMWWEYCQKKLKEENASPVAA